MDDGIELLDTNVVRREAIRCAGSLLEGGAAPNDLGEDWRTEIADETGLVPLRPDFRVSEVLATAFAERHDPL